MALGMGLDQIGDVVGRGVPSFKIYTTFGRRDPPSKVDDGHLWAAMTEVARHGGIMVVHAEDDDIVEFMLKMLPREGRGGVSSYTWSTTTFPKTSPSAK